MAKEKRAETIDYLQREAIDFDLDRPDRSPNLIYYFTRQRRGPQMKIKAVDRLGFCATLVTEGQAVFEQLGQTAELHHGSVFLRRHNLPYRFYKTDDEPLELIMVMFDPAIKPFWDDLIEPDCIAVQLANGTEVIELVNHFFNLLNRDPHKRIERANAFAPFVLETVMADRIQLSDHPDANRRLAEKCRNYIHDHVCRIHSIDEVAEACHLCRTSLYSLFQTHFQITPKDYLERLRLGKACDLLTQTDWTMERIAEETGYTDAPTLSKAFKRRNGVSPAEWRRNTAAFAH